MGGGTVTLRAGQRIRMAGKTWRVIHVNASRAHCKCEAQQTVSFKDIDKKTGEERQHAFTATSGQTLDISPDSIVEMLDDETLPAEVLRVLPPEEEPTATQVVAPRSGAGWYRTETTSALREGSKMDLVLKYVIACPGRPSSIHVAALGHGTDQILQDLKRKGLVERR